MKLTFFTPHMALWAHVLPEALLVRSLAELGHEINYLSCGRAQTYCAAMTANRHMPQSTPKETDHVCRDCSAHAKSISGAYGFPISYLNELLVPDDYSNCRAMADHAVATRSFKTVLHGVNVGQFCLFEPTLLYKKLSLDYTSEQWDDYGVYLYNSLIVLTGFAKYLDQNNVDAILSYCPQYSNINPCMELAKLRGIRYIFLEGGINLGYRLGSMRVWEWDPHRLMNPALKSWGSADCHRITEADAERLTNHFRELLGGVSFTVFSSQFSGVEDIRKRWNIAPHQKILLATTSSFDERFANYLIGASPPELFHSDVFEDQAAWLRATIDWMREKPDYFLIIRQHPRDFPNKRTTRRSEQSYVFEEAVKERPSNVVVNVPSDNISFYGMLEQTDVVITAWSSTATEALMLGIPVVPYDGKLPLYPADITYAGSSRESYFAQIEKALADGWSFENVRKAFRWLGYVYEQATIRISPYVGRFELAQKRGFDFYSFFIKRFHPHQSRWIELMMWRPAREGAKVVDRILTENKTSILEVRPPVDLSIDDDATIRNQLEQLYGLIYGRTESQQETMQNTNGLRSKIRSFLDAPDSTRGNLNSHKAAP